MAGMTPKQQRFVEEYMVDLNATAAAKRAGYSARTAEWQGPQLLGKTHVAAAVAGAMQAKAVATGRTVAGVMADIGRVRDDAMQLVADPDTGVQSMVSHKDALKALELEGKHLGAFTERLEVAGKGGAPVAVDLTGASLEQLRALASLRLVTDAP